MSYVHAAQFQNGVPVFGATKTSDIRKGFANTKKDDTPEKRAARLELYRVRLEAGLDIFDGSLKGDM
mgnify:CR=1 FL=1|tara:strand:- start:202 stop:402 length:201 start_codon:yes stop_codon:yes gene_type:complete